MTIPAGLPAVWVVTGPSGSGKTTLCNLILRHWPHSRPLRRVTTRAIRPNDMPGDYTSLPHEEFDRRHRAGEFVWVFPRNGYAHATAKKEADEALTGCSTIVTDLSVPATEKLLGYVQENYPASVSRVKTVFLDLQDEDEARRRLLKRGENEHKISELLCECREWREHAKASFVPYRFIDALASERDIFRQALRHFTSP